MKKKLRSMKGFAMAELLAVSLVILVLFSVLFSNYLPLVAEYENRIMYNDVSAQYAAYYVRQIVNENIDDTKFTTYKTKIDDVGYAQLYGETAGINNGNPLCALTISEKEKDICNLMVATYKIKEVIVTKYKLTSIKDKTNGYKQSDGSLYEYIQYLPEYKNTIYTEENELYRIILKADNKYATTPVKVDYTTPGKCFTGTKDGNNLTITGYNAEDLDCGKDIIISTKNITIKDSNNKNITGKITKIGENAFKDKEINSIDLGGVIDIGSNAFEGSTLSNIIAFDKSSVTLIGASAFLGTQLEEVKLPKNLSSIGNNAFSNIKQLETISLTNEDIYGGTSGLFSKSGSQSGIKVTFLSGIKTIGEKMFYNTNIKANANELDLSNVTEIKNEAFKMEKNNTKNPTISYLDLPPSLEKLGESAFENRNISKLTIPSSIQITAIPKKAFYNCGMQMLVFGEANQSIVTIGESAFERNGLGKNNDGITIPKSVTSLGINAFPFENVNQFHVSEKTFDAVDWCYALNLESDNCVTDDVDSNRTYMIRDNTNDNKFIYLYVNK